MTEQSTMTETQWHALCEEVSRKLEQTQPSDLTVYAFMELAPSIQPDSAVDTLTGLFESEHKRIAASNNVEIIEDVYYAIGDGTDLLPNLDLSLSGVWHSVYSADMTELFKRSNTQDMNLNRTMLVILAYSLDSGRNLLHKTEVMFLPELQRHLMTGEHALCKDDTT